MVDKKEKAVMPLRTVADISDAQEWLFNSQREGVIDTKTADGMNTTLKGVVYLKATLPLKIFEAMVRAQIKKINVPTNLLPIINQPQP